MPQWFLSILLLFLLQVHVSSLHVGSLEHRGAVRRWNQREQCSDQQGQGTPGPRRPTQFYDFRGSPDAVLRMGGGSSEDEDNDPLASRVRRVSQKQGDDFNGTAAWNQFASIFASPKPDPKPAEVRRPRTLTLTGVILDCLIASQLLVAVQLLVDLCLAIPVLRFFTTFALPMLRPVFDDFPLLGEASVVLSHWGIRLSKSLLASMAAGFLLCLIASTKLCFHHPALPLTYAACTNLYSTWNFLERIAQDEDFKGRLSFATIAFRVLTCEVPGLLLFVWLVLAGTRDGGLKNVRHMWAQLWSGSPHGSARHQQIKPGSSSWLDMDSDAIKQKQRSDGRTWAERTAAWVEKTEGDFVRAVRKAVDGGEAAAENRTAPSPPRGLAAPSSKPGLTAPNPFVRNPLDFSRPQPLQFA
eukprot:CAMPEP_0177696632 /NCGR_PEP_ID=MMETSP0484_2-20121128/4083_1 /TAXON_ID=354590 /ORGANISM="Rhodomonas lens, Strain RHODO" /LENGTH=412 /DNA_ID=CAMNT_0019207615 /DNA_START=46 /DNA_END=1280 /DNA_ORIENTATION=-